MSEDLAHDAHLRTALRHAPDHALSPPAGLSQTILAAARKAHRPPRPAPAPPPVRMRAAGSRRFAWLRRLSSPRWAGALATSLVAALGLGLWLDLGTEPVIERSGPIGGDAAPAPLAKAEPTPPAAPPAGATPRDTLAAAKTTDSALLASVPQSDGPRAATRREATRLAEPSAIVDTPPRQRQDVDATYDRVAAQTALQAAAEGRQRAAPTGQKPAESDTVAAQDARAAAGRTAPPTAASGLRVSQTPNAALKLGADAVLASPARALLQRVEADVASGSARWTWAVTGGSGATVFDDSARAWLERVAAQSEGRWGDTAERGESVAAVEVRWWRDGRLQATLRIEADALRWIEPGARVRRAALDAGTLQRLRSF